MSYFNLNAINCNAKALHRMEFLFCNCSEVTGEFCVASMNNDFHNANNVTATVKM